MVLEARLAEQLSLARNGLSRTIEKVLLHARLPVSRPAGLNAEDILTLTKRDKKARGGTVQYALPAELGHMAGSESGWSIPVEDGAVLEILG